MTQPKKYLVTKPAGASTLKEALATACGGNRKLGDLLYYFLDDSAFIAERTGQNPEKLECIRLTSLPLDKIAKGVGASKVSLNKWISQLEKLGYITADGYHQRYDIYFRKVQEALLDPPAKVASPPRGVHARKSKELTSEENKDSEELTLDYKNKLSESKELTFGMSEVHSLILNLQSEILNLHSLLSHERACREALEAKVEGLYTDRDTEINTEEDHDESPSPSPPSLNLMVSLNSSDSVGDTQQDELPIVTPSYNDTLNLANTHTLPESSRPVPNSSHEPTDTDAVMPNDTEQPYVITQEMLLMWVEQAGAKVSRRAPNADYLERLLQVVTGFDDVQDLYSYAREKYRKGEIWLGNLVEKDIVARLQGEKDAIRQMTGEVPFDEEWRDFFLDNLLQEHCELICYKGDDGAGHYCVFLAMSDDFRACIRHMKDWHDFIRGEDGRARLEQALECGRWYWWRQQQQAVEQEREAVLV